MTEQQQETVAESIVKEGGTPLDAFNAATSAGLSDAEARGDFEAAEHAIARLEGEGGIPGAAVDDALTKAIINEIRDGALAPVRELGAAQAVDEYAKESINHLHAGLLDDIARLTAILTPSPAAGGEVPNAAAPAPVTVAKDTSFIVKGARVKLTEAFRGPYKGELAAVCAVNEFELTADLELVNRTSVIDGSRVYLQRISIDYIEKAD